ncbi:hypothetical protein N7539_003729 [Penicillium diatomitis]|uniref:Uncharacterized protein n=1 Tax=Penicillium diatomitis TaxID=2819901 RepID=A0A9W9XCM4_9EURO|nr:uncharacterized protein N7539_003729 [Penicillium diatomitis]KAJ5488839.1 hypothetical protein N7539_003729 [Penicillium diatomitis]
MATKKNLRAPSAPPAPASRAEAHTKKTAGACAACRKSKKRCRHRPSPSPAPSSSAVPAGPASSSAVLSGSALGTTQGRRAKSTRVRSASVAAAGPSGERPSKRARPLERPAPTSTDPVVEAATLSVNVVFAKELAKRLAEFEASFEASMAAHKAVMEAGRAVRETVKSWKGTWSAASVLPVAEEATEERNGDD